MFNLDIQQILIMLPGIIIGLTVHEFCHALASYKLGDHTAKDMGRLTFNPIKHMDPIGFLFIIFAGFGWAKPVQFNPMNLKKPRRDKVIIAAAGPASNLLLALLFAGIIRLTFYYLETLYNNENYELYFRLGNSGVLVFTIQIIIYAVQINLGLMVFNLLPIPPLDGSHIAFSGFNLSPQMEYRIMRLGAPLLFLIIIAQNVLNITILPIGYMVMGIYNFLLPF